MKTQVNYYEYVEKSTVKTPPQKNMFFEEKLQQLGSKK